MATRIQPDGQCDELTGAIMQHPKMTKAQCLSGLQNALEGCRERMHHYQGVTPDNSAYNRWHAHARSIERAIELLQ